MAHHADVAEDVIQAVRTYEQTRPSGDGNCTGGLVGLSRHIARRHLKNESRADEVRKEVDSRFKNGFIVKVTVRGKTTYWPKDFAPNKEPAYSY